MAAVPPCKKPGCRGTCEVKTSHSPKNPNRNYWRCTACNDFYGWVDAARTPLTAPGPKCLCGVPTVQRTTQKQNENHGRAFWRCASTGRAPCKFFKWCEEAAPPAAGGGAGSGAGGGAGGAARAAPPPAPKAAPGQAACSKCSAPVQHKIAREKQRPYYKCGHCQLFAWLDSPAGSPSKPPAAPPAEGELPGSVEHCVDEFSRRHLQALFEVPRGERLGHGRNNAAPCAPYDSLHVLCAWRTTNLQRAHKYAQMKRAVAAGCAARAAEVQPPPLSEAFAAKGRALLAHAQQPPLDGACHESLLLHGTRPEALYDILFKGLDPGLARLGLYGCGTYLAQDGAKADQYATPDPRWAGHEQGSLGQLHAKLYGGIVRHPGDCCYALVCRAALGDVATTTDGATELRGGGRLVADGSQRALSGGRHALVAVPPERAFREVVLFERDAVHIEYLVCYARERKRCAGCGSELLERSVGKEGPNKGRRILLCPHDRGSPAHGSGSQGGGSQGGGSQHQAEAGQAAPGSCPQPTTLMLPACHCGLSAAPKQKRDGAVYFVCNRAVYGGRGAPQCSFKDWNDRGRHTGGNTHPAGPQHGAPQFGTPDAKRPRTG